ncbi:MAG: MYG1 family protein [Verrucomicrobia bacterium]|nr:MYG1 family protein [Verrucomicrobiota bacterium]
MTIGIISRSLGTHDGSFHADEVTASALLVHFGLIDRDKIVRTREDRRLDACDFVCDVGGFYDPSRRRFDHHQLEYTGDLSSAGMILEYLRDEKIISRELFSYLRYSLVKGIDEIDNGKCAPRSGHCSFSQVISNFVPPAYEASEEEFNSSFFEALDFVLGFLMRAERKYHYLQKCKSLVGEVMNTMRECLIFDRAMPWVEAFFELEGERHPAEFVIMPSGKHWKLRGVPPTYDRRMEVRHPLPKEWAGLLGKELKEESGIKGAVFCHKGRFTSVWETKEDALKALKIVLGHKDD